MPLTLCLLAALAFTGGGVFMKIADGPRVSLATAAWLALFVAGAALQAKALRGADLGPTYVVVLGLEAALALVFGTFFFSEDVTAHKLAAVSLIVAGIALLRIQ